MIRTLDMDALTLASGAHAEPDELTPEALDRHMCVMEASQKLVRRFWSHVNQGAESDCWLWTGRTDEKGYGRISVGKRKNVGAHRIAWELAVGAIPDRFCVLHRCDNPPCVNPRHLFLGTNTDNVHDRHAKGRSKNIFPQGDTHPAHIRRGQQHWCARLSDSDIQQIRQRREAGETVTRLAADYGVHHATISRIARGIWRQEVEHHA